MEYGTGAIFGCPGHDERDHEFATKYGLPIIPVVMPEGADAEASSVAAEPFVEDGVIINSDFLNGLDVEDAKSQGHRAAGGDGRRQGHDRSTACATGWSSRQRYWGCADPGHPLREAAAWCRCRRRTCRSSCRRTSTFDRPGNPLDRHPTWKHVACPTLRRAGTARDRHVRHLHRFELVLRPLHLAAARRRRRSIARRTTTGCRSTSISAASSTRSCICSIRASGRAPCARSR